MSAEKDKPLVFLLEDNDFFAQSVTIGLEKKRLAVVWFRNGADLLDDLKIRRPDVIILDYQLEGNNEKALNGGHFLEIIKAMYPEIPVLMLTSLSDTREAVKLLKAGAVDFIAKDDYFFENLHKSLADLLRAKDLSKAMKDSQRQLKKLNFRLAAVLLIVSLTIGLLILYYK